MDFEKPCCPVVEVDGNIACGKQFDLDITLPCVLVKKYQRERTVKKNGSLTLILLCN
ncbi:MAG: hypothetical protein HFJ26_04155 [Clostridia bacterium]|nr:hypothetical protein [Clostridia bacterium]